MKSNLKIFILLIFFFNAITHASLSSDILIKNFKGTNYRHSIQSCYLSNGTPVTQIRQFQMTISHDTSDYALVVDNEKLSTFIERTDLLYDCYIENLTTEYVRTSNYQKALFDSTTQNAKVYHNAGAIHELNGNPSIYLTVDLCPSHKQTDINLFEKIKGGVKPVPVAISISGHWLINHEPDLQKLLELQRLGEVQITWVNHTYTHPYDSKLPDENNFILMPMVKFDSEVFHNEILMLKNGLIPSVFFRFPGLISNQNDINLLREWGLIPLGADAWLALGQKAKVGSFILVHGNGNEPKGLKILYDNMEKNTNLKKIFADIKQAFQY